MAFDPSDYAPVGTSTAAAAAPAPSGTPAPTGTPAPQPSAAPANPSSSSFNASDYQPLPSYANGMSPLTPINSSPLSAEDRFQLALGDEKGKQAFLKQRFSDIQKDGDGNQVVQDKQTGLWHRTSADAFKDVDPWTATKGIIRTVGALGVLGFNQQAAQDMADQNPVSKELLGTYADMAPKLAAAGLTTVAGPAAAALGEAATLGSAAALPFSAGTSFALSGIAGTAAEAVATGASALLARGAVTSFGRLEGTYQATPEEQLSDAAKEGLFNAGGVFFMAGAKVPMGALSDKMGSWAGNMNLIPQSAKDTFKALYGRIALGEGGAQHFDEALENTEGVQQMMDMGAKAGGGPDGFKQRIFQDQIQTVKNAAETGRQMLRALYGKLSDQLGSAVPANFVGDVSEATSSAMKALADKGLLELEVGGERVSAADAAEILADGGKSIGKDMRWVVKSKDALKQALARGDSDIASVLSNDETHAALSKVVETMNDLSAGKAYGREGAKMLMNTQQALNDLTYQIQQTAKEGSNNSLANLMAAIHDHVSQGFSEQFEKYGAGEAFARINSSYAAMKQPMTDLQNAVAKAAKSGSDAPLETFIKKISAKGSSMSAKNSFQAISETADKFGLTKLAQDFEGHAARLRAGDAAVAFNPWIKSDVLSRNALGGAGVALMTGHPGLAMAVGGTMAATSPRLAYNSTLAVKTFQAAKAQLAAMGASGVQRMAQNPQAMQLFARSVLATPSMANAVQQNLMQPVSQFLPGGGGGQ